MTSSSSWMLRHALYDLEHREKTESKHWPPLSYTLATTHLQCHYLTRRYRILPKAWSQSLIARFELGITLKCLEITILDRERSKRNFLRQCTTHESILKYVCESAFFIYKQSVEYDIIPSGTS